MTYLRRQTMHIYIQIFIFILYLYLFMFIVCVCQAASLPTRGCYIVHPCMLLF